MFGKVLFYNYILFRIWNRIAISSIELRLSGVTLGFLTFPCSFFPSKKANKVHYYPIFLPSQMIISWVDIMPIRVRPSGTTPSNTDPHPPGTHLGLVTELGLSVFGPSQLDLPAQSHGTSPRRPINQFPRLRLCQGHPYQSYSRFYSYIF